MPLPVDADERWGLRALSDYEHRTFIRLLLCARIFEPRRAHLVSPPPRLKPWSQRELARLTGVPRSTLQGHIPRLVRGGQLIQSMSGELIVRGLLDWYDDDESASPGENGGGAQAPPAPSGRGTGHLPAWGSAPTPKQEQITTYGRPEIEPLGKTDFGQPLSTADVMAELPPFLDNSTARYLLAKLALGWDRWAGMLASARDLAVLRRLHESYPGALVYALQQATDDPDGIRNPGAWLTRVVPALAEQAS